MSRKSERNGELDFCRRLKKMSENNENIRVKPIRRDEGGSKERHERVWERAKEEEGFVCKTSSEEEAENERK
jgi:hypothetical protein